MDGGQRPDRIRIRTRDHRPHPSGGVCPPGDHLVRHEFDVADPGSFTTALLEYIADDGAVVYLNGQEIDRTRMAPGPVDAFTRAHAAISTTAAHADPTRIEVPSSLFRAGRNVLAAETHINYRSSPNMSFDASLLITDFSPAPEPEDPPQEILSIPEGSVWSYWYDLEAPPAAWDTVDDVSTWSLGVAPIGWGHGGVATVLSVPPAERARTMYFVRDIDVDLSRVPEGAHVILKVRADDGALVRLNGVEVGRKRMSEGVVTHHTNAEIAVNTATAIADPLEISIPVSDLLSGTNRIAVETHLNYRSTPSATFEFSAEVVVP